MAVLASHKEHMAPLPVRVLRSHRELADTWTLELDPGPLGAKFAPGQFNMLYVFGVGEIPVSISGDPANTSRWVHTVRAVGLASAALCAVKAGDMVGIRGPFGSFWPMGDAEGSDLLFVCGGLGLAPLRPAILTALRLRERYGRIAVLVGAREPSALLFEKELHEWRGRFDVEVEVTVDSAGRGWFGEVGWVTRLIDHVRFDTDFTHAMVCGPEIMMRLAARDLVDRGVAAENVFLSLERNMKCAIAICGHCQYGATLLCRDGAVLPYSRVATWLGIREL